MTVSLNAYVDLEDEDPIDCETCGFSYDAAEIEIFSDGKVEIRVRLGCYGGDSYDGDRRGASEFLSTLAESYSDHRRDELDELANWLDIGTF
ncbi:hypothetical protein N806_29840 [Rhodococcus sp. P27]|nr:hypothetical protein N806_29840 [Rhodococcus sp. P27]